MSLSKFSYMEPPLGVVISTSRKSSTNQRSNKNDTNKNEGTKPILCYLFSKGVLFRKPSITECAELVNVSIQGETWKRLKKNGYHVFRSKDFIFIDYNKLPIELKEKIGDFEDA